MCINIPRKMSHFGKITRLNNYKYQFNLYINNIVMLLIIILISIILIYVYINTNNIELFENNKMVSYNLGKIPLYNTNTYIGLLWQLRYKNLIKNRYAYDDTNNKKIIKTTTNWDCGNSGTNCHGNNCDETNCYGNNCYEKDFALLKDLPTCQNQLNCPINKLP